LDQRPIADLEQRLAGQARGGETRGYDDVIHVIDRLQGSSSGSSAFKVLASSGSITGIPSRTA
jgi:hypothetical protein